ncbi:MAG: sodium:alanine symporter family protein [Lachnospiraceae bacterium]|nr:sodium:alanine symporter family protein [Lachnospiraceae bacterium]
MNVLEQIVSTVNSWLWDYLLIFLLCGTGVYFTIRLRFVQVRLFPQGIRQLFSGFSLHGKAADDKGMSSFQALTTAIAAQVGTGNIAGAATALASGGPGAIFWMWMSAFFGMATIYGEAILAQKYKTEVDGRTVGGPAYYIRAAYKGKPGKFLATFFSVAIILALGFMGNLVQSNSIGDSFQTAFGIQPIYICIVVAVISAFIFIGGVKRIASVTEKMVPVMALLYIVGCAIILFINRGALPDAFRQIFVMAFNPEAALGGVAGVTVQKAMRYGVARGLFSNEAGMGSTPHAHAMAKVKDPREQGILAMIGVFIDTFIILTLTALVIVSSGALATGKSAAPLAQEAFTRAFGPFGSSFIAICMLFFAFSTIVGWYFFGESNVRALFGKRAVPVYAVIAVIFITIGAFPKVDLVWNLSDLFNGLMVIPNLLGMLALSKVIVDTQKK